MKSDIYNVNLKAINKLKKLAEKNPDGKVRLCLHKDPKDLFQEMIIVHSRNTYIRPHKHDEKDESISIVEGECRLLIFDKKGRIIKRILLSRESPHGTLICRINKNIWHSMKVLSDLVVFHEVSTGPFEIKKSNTFPLWDKTCK